MALDPTVQVAIIGAVSSVVTLIVGWLLNRHLKTSVEHASAAREQVQNSHTTNLRDDIDRVLAGIAALELGQRRHDKEFEGIRQDMAHERSERQDVSRRVDDHIRGHAA